MNGAGDGGSKALPEEQTQRRFGDLAGGVFRKAGNKPSLANLVHPVLHGFRYIPGIQFASAAAPGGAEKGYGADEHEGENQE